MIVVRDNEILLNGVYYPTMGSPVLNLASVYPPKQVIGDYTKESEHDISSWIIADQRGGILVEEMDEKKDADRAFFSTCDLRFKGHIFLPPLATSINLTSGAPVPSTETLRPTGAGDETNIGFSANGTATETLRPNGVGDETNLSDSPSAGDNYEKVDEAVADDGATIVLNNTSGWLRDLYNLPAHGGTGDVINIILSVRGQTADAGLYKGAIKTGGTVYETSEYSDSPFATNTTTYELNPNTGVPWTWAEIDALQIGCACYKTGAPASSSEVTQVFVTVTYSAGAHYTKVDEAGADDSDYVNELVGRTKRDLYAIADSGVGAGTITKVMAYARGKSSGGGSFKTALKTHGNVYEGDAETSAAYALKSSEYINNPFSGTAWTWAEVDDIQVGVELVGVAYCSQIYIIVSYTASATVTNVPWVNYNGKLYVAHGTKLQSLDITGDGFTTKDTLPVVITDLVVGEDNSLYILQGAADYEYLDIGGSVNLSGYGGGILGIHWNNNLYVVDVNGEIFESTDPSNAAAGFNGKGKLEPQLGGVINSMLVSDDAEGDPIIYVGTTKGLFAHDLTNSKFWPTKLQVPKHPQAGKGLVEWRGSIYFSSGLDVLQYTAGRTAYIESTGLNKEGGLPAEYRGVITKLIAGYNEIYAIVDSTLSPDLSYSTIMAYNGQGWTCLWAGGTYGLETFSGIVSDEYTYQLWWDWNGKGYYIDMAKDLHNPLKILHQTFASSSLHITPWFDADAAASDKLAKSVSLSCSGMSASEDIIVKYRIDHAYTDLDSGWTTQGTIEADGETSYDFASSVGTVFKAIQFRFDLATGTSTLTPDIHWVKLRYAKLLPAMWAWNVMVDCSQKYKGKTASQLTSALKTAVESQTLLTFVFRNDAGSADTQYVRVKALPSGKEYTGKDIKGKYNLLLSEVA